MNEKHLNEIIKFKQSARDGLKEDAKIIKECLVVESGHTLQAIQIEYLMEVFDIKDSNDIVRIPFTPDYLLGIINNRGEIIPVVSLEKILGETCEPVFRKMVVLEEAMKLAFPVADILDLIRVDVKDIRSIKNINAGEKEAFINGEFDMADKRVFVVDILKMMRSPLFL